MDTDDYVPLAKLDKEWVNTPLATGYWIWRDSIDKDVKDLFYVIWEPEECRWEYYRMGVRFSAPVYGQWIGPFYLPE